MLDRFFISILNMSIVSSYVIAFVLIARLLLKKVSKIFSFALWAVVLFRLLCPFSFESVLSILPNNIAPISQDILYSQAPQINTGIGVVDNSINPALPIPNMGDSVNPLQVWSFIGSLVWIIGIIVLLIYSIAAFIILKRKLTGSTPLCDNIYLADHISSPFVMGLIKPKIYLPSSLSAHEQDFIIAHENCHIKRLDHITRILAFLALALHWFNPLVWIAFILSGKDMELSCDEAVTKRMDTDIRAEYTQSLLRFATGKKMLHATPLAFGEGDTKSRVKNVLNYKKPAFWVSIVAVIVVACVAVGLISSPKSESETMPIEAKGVSVERLWENRTKYLGNNSAVGNIVLNLSFPDGVTYDGIELNTKAIPYMITINFKTDSETRNYYAGELHQQEFKDNALIIFSLVENVNYVTFSLDDDVLEPYSFQYTSDQAKFILGENYFSKTETLEGFKAVLSELLGTGTLSDFKAIKIGTTREKVHERFGEPADMLSGMLGDVYIVDDKRIIIYYGSDKALGYPVTEIKVDDYAPKKLTHDQAVTSALFSLSDRYLEGECISEGHIILGYDDSDENKTKIYALTEIGWYGFENNNFAYVSGSAFPAVITLSSDNTAQIELPLDGSDNAASIKKMFPKEYHDKVFKYGDAERENLKQQREKYASEYLSKIGRNAKIGEYSDFDYTSLTDEGVSVGASNNLENFYKAHSYYPSFIGTRERLEDGVRMVYETSYHENQDEIRFTKYDYDTKQILEQFIADSKTGNIVE